MKGLIFFDFEVYAHDTLFGTKIVDSKSSCYMQTWNLEEVRQFFMSTREDYIYVGYNNCFYDNLILEHVMKNYNEEQLKQLNEDMIRGGKRPWQKMKFYSYDVMNNYPGMISLKTTEAAAEKSIDETSIDFLVDKKLTEEEKQEVEAYNRKDLDQTELTFEDTKYQFELRLSIIQTFNLDLQSSLNATGTSLAAKVLGAKHIHGIDAMEVKPTIWPTLQLENADLLEYYLSNSFRTDKKLDIQVGNATIRCGSGGAHSAIKKYHSKHFLYFDVSGYYNLIMINYGLLPRTLGEEGSKRYTTMYYDQLAMKKTDPHKRRIYKTILLSVFGAMMNEHTDFYDPWHGLLVTITGQMFIVDLLEKLKDLVIIIQTNTDGLMVEPKDWNDKDKIIDIVKAWMTRTGFVIKIEEMYDLYQRDVNCYICRDKDGNITKKGNRFFDYFIGTASNATIPYIISKGIEDYFMKDISPEDTVHNNLDKLGWYQYIAKKRSYDYCTYDIYVDGKLQESLPAQAINRAFPLVHTDFEASIYKHKDTKKSKIPNLPDNVFICNLAIEEHKDLILDMIDLDYYVLEIYKYIQEFIGG